MVQFYLITLGMYLYYSKSKYFPRFLLTPKISVVNWIGFAFALAGAVFYIHFYGWVGGVLLALIACTLAMGLVQLFAVFGKAYFYGLTGALHLLLIIELINYAR